MSDLRNRSNQSVAYQYNQEKVRVDNKTPTPVDDDDIKTFKLALPNTLISIIESRGCRAATERTRVATNPKWKPEGIWINFGMDKDKNTWEIGVDSQGNLAFASKGKKDYPGYKIQMTFVGANTDFDIFQKTSPVYTKYTDPEEQNKVFGLLHSAFKSNQDPLFLEALNKAVLEVTEQKSVLMPKKP